MRPTSTGPKRSLNAARSRSPSLRPVSAMSVRRSTSKRSSGRSVKSRAVDATEFVYVLHVAGGPERRDEGFDAPVQSYVCNVCARERLRCSTRRETPEIVACSSTLPTRKLIPTTWAIPAPRMCRTRECHRCRDARPWRASASARRRGRTRRTRRRSRRGGAAPRARLDCPAEEDERGVCDRPGESGDLDGPEAQESGSISHESSATAGIRKTATCAAEASAISAASAIFPREATTIAARRARRRCRRSRRSPRRRRTRDSPTVSRERLERADEDLGDERRDDRRDREHDERRAQRPAAATSSSAATCSARCRRSEYQVTRDVDDEQHDRDRARRAARARRCRGRRASRAPTERGRASVASAMSPSERKLENRSSCAVAARRRATRRARAGGSPTTLPVSEPRTTSVSPSLTAMQRDDQLRRVAEGRVEEAADAGPGVLGGVLGRLADQPRERDRATSAASTNSTVVGGCDGVVEGDRERRERERREEELAHHARGPYRRSPGEPRRVATA